MNSETLLTENTPKVYQVGTLTYTSRQVAAVFFWMLFGAAVMTLQNTVFNIAMPYLLRDYGLNDSLIIAAMSSLLAVMNTIMNPILSFRSDRCRTKLGRRRPFILYTAFPLGIAIAVLPFLGTFSNYLTHVIPGITMLLPEGMPLVVPVAFLGVALYFFFFLFVGAIYYYYIPDVIPAEMMGRYYGLFRVMGAGSGFLFSLLLLKPAVEQPQIVFPITGLVYAVVATLMCLIVKEGSYPPPENCVTAAWYIRLYGAVRSYVVDCFRKPYYMLFFLVTSMIGLSYCLGSFFNFFLQESCHFSVDNLSELGSLSNIISLLCCLGCGLIVDRISGIKCYMLGIFGMALVNFLGGVFMCGFWTVFLFQSLLVAFTALQSVASGKVLIEVFPKSKFGQFASAQAMVASLTVAILNYPIGLFADFIRNTQKAVEAQEIAEPWFLKFLGNYRFINYHSALSLFIAFLILLVFISLHRKRTVKASDL